MTKLRLLQTLREALTFDPQTGAIHTGFGLIIPHPGEWRIEYEDVENCLVFVDKHAFVGHLGELYIEDQLLSDEMEDDEEFLGDLVDDDENRRNMHKKMGYQPGKPGKEEIARQKMIARIRGFDSVEQFSNLPGWNNFCENFAIIDKF